jgi:hypothetical protein
MTPGVNGGLVAAIETALGDTDSGELAERGTGMVGVFDGELETAREVASGGI